jgi:uncharacterized protein (TIGR02270 family)
MHGADLGTANDLRLDDESDLVRARALRAFGELGRRDLLPCCSRWQSEKDEATRFWASWSAVLLGDRSAGLDGVKTTAETPGPLQERAFVLTLQTMDCRSSTIWLRRFLAAANLRAAIRGSGIVGDPACVPWLLDIMTDSVFARLAGEAFSTLTGVDLVSGRLDTPPPTHDCEPPSGSDVEMDPDAGMPWPSPKLIAQWWETNGSRFTGGMRYFMGAEATSANCLGVLRDGSQQQRSLAAHYLALLAPGKPLFGWRAPAIRQQRMLRALCSSARG